MTNLPDLPDEVRAAIGPENTEDDVTLDAISQAIAEKRDEAKAARTQSGIETIWREAEEAYIGIDDANRHEFKDSRWSKPMSSDGPVTTGQSPRGTDVKSTAFVRLTARYVDAGAGKLTEILLPPDDKPFSFSETPVPELISAKEDASQVILDHMGNVPAMRAPKPGEVPPQNPLFTAIPGSPAWNGQTTPSAPFPPSAPGAAPTGLAGTPPVGAGPASQVPVTVKDLAEENIETARKSAKKAEQRIYDQMVESRFTTQMRKVITDAAKLGVGVVKGPYPKSQKGIVVKKGENGGVEIIIEQKIKPAAIRVDPWNFFPDPGCGDNVHDGDYVLERDYLSRKQVRDLKKLPGYISAQIDKVLEEGPLEQETNEGGEAGASRDPNGSSKKGRFPVWYYYGTLARKEIESAWAAGNQKEGASLGLKDDQDEVYSIVTLINNTIIKATLNPLDSGEFPYDTVPWQPKADSWAGIGVAEQCAMPQKTVNAAIRAMFNNAGISAGGQFIIDTSCIQPADGNWVITPNKIWYKTGEGAALQDVRQAFTAVQIPNVTAQLMSIIELGMRLAQEQTSIPLIAQGQDGPTTPDTLGAAQIQNSNANQLLRTIGYAFDDYITEPMVTRWYEWNLLDPDVPDDEKAEFKVNAHGSVTLVERAIADSFLWQLSPLVTNAAFMIDPAKWMALVLKSKRLNPEDVQYTKEQQDKIDQQPPQQPPQVQVAQIASDTQLKLGVMKQTTEQQSIQSEQNIAAAAHELEGQKTQVKATVDLHTQSDETKVQLAKTAMQLDTERQLNAANNLHELHRGAVKPPVQAPGRAANGEAFTQANQ